MLYIIYTGIFIIFGTLRFTYIYNQVLGINIFWSKRDEITAKSCLPPNVDVIR